MYSGRLCTYLVHSPVWEALFVYIVHLKPFTCGSEFVCSITFNMYYIVKVTKTELLKYQSIDGL